MSVARRKKARKQNPGVVSGPLEKPREECSYNEVYPKLNAARRLQVVYATSSKATDTNARPTSSVSTKKRSFRKIEPFASKESYVDGAMATAGYLTSDKFDMPDAYIRTSEQPRIEEEEKVLVSDKEPQIQVEYDMDEQDENFLNNMNQRRSQQDCNTVSKEIFEITMTLLEIEWYMLERRMPPKKKATATDEIQEVDEQRCTVCDEAECDNSNAIVFCDSCDIAVHQECYGVPFIPEGQWLCAQCQISRRRKAACVLCPNKIGALKPTDTQHWAHVVCGIWIPEVSFKNTIYMEPIIGVNRIPKGRWGLVCYICKVRTGACVQCCKPNCTTAYHPTCARKAKLYMKLSAGPLGALTDPQSMLTYCHKHSPQEYAEQEDVNHALATAQEFYSQNEEQPEQDGFDWQNPARVVRATKFVRKKSEHLHQWRTEEGTPVIPALIALKINTKLSKFHIHKSKEYVYEVCRFWALKRQNKRGAALSKRLQMALDASAQRPQQEPTEEDHEKMFETVYQLRKQVAQVCERERSKLVDAEREDERFGWEYYLTDKLCQPILDKLVEMENEYLEATDAIQEKFEKYGYTCVEEFIQDVTALCTSSDKHANSNKTGSKILKALGPLFRSARQEEAKRDPQAGRFHKAVNGAADGVDDKDNGDGNGNGKGNGHAAELNGNGDENGRRKSKRLKR